MKEYYCKDCEKHWEGDEFAEPPALTNLCPTCGQEGCDDPDEWPKPDYYHYERENPR